MHQFPGGISTQQPAGRTAAGWKFKKTERTSEKEKKWLQAHSISTQYTSTDEDSNWQAFLLWLVIYEQLLQNKIVKV
jgi:hypothetical protein